jgi:hypothetical protein
MDLVEAMKLWEEMGNQLISWDRPDGYYTLFVEEPSGQVKGHCKANGGGFFWEWPDSLIEYKKKLVVD